MLTLFTTAKPFRGHIGMIQRNALKSWTLLGPGVEVILFGDDAGAAEACRELGIRHEPRVEKHESGLNYVNYMFDRAEQLARNDVLCYLNCDIILTDDFLPAIAAVKRAYSKFLMVSRRWDTDVTAPVDFSDPHWSTKLRALAHKQNRQRDGWWIDYFAFSRGLYYGQIPSLVVGRVYWDNWMLWYAQQSGAAFVDASKTVCAIHQDHDYGHHPQGKQGVWTDELSQRNLALVGGGSHLRTIGSAVLQLTPGGLRRSPWSWYPEFRRKLSPLNLMQTLLWHPILAITRPLRTSLGLRRNVPRG
jgi:hypothetical protein